MLKLHQNCLGETESYPKIKVNREEFQSVIQQLEKIYTKMEDKMIKDAINRNANIKKSQD
jgi:tetrahydromethanopterin S-methyltransferase subunit G